MNNEDMKSIFDQINNLKKPVTESKETNAEYEKDTFREVLNGISEEIKEYWMKMISHRRIYVG